LTASDQLKRELASLGELDDNDCPSGSGQGANASSSNSFVGTRGSAKLSTVRTNCKGVVMLRVGAPVRRFANASSSAGQSAEPNGEGPTAEVPTVSTSEASESDTLQKGEAASRHQPWKRSRAQEGSENSTGNSSQALQLLPLVDPVAVLRSLFLAVADSKEACSRHVVR